MPGSQQTEEKMFWKPNRTDKRIILHIAACPVYTTPNMLPLTKLELSDVVVCPLPWELCKIYKKGKKGLMSSEM